MLSKIKKKQKPPVYKKLVLPLVVILMFAVSAGLAVANINMFRKKAALNAQVESLQRKIADTKAKNEKLQQGIEQSGNDAYIEKVAREELDLQKPGEQVVSFVTAEALENPAVTKKKNIFQAWVGVVEELFK